jgi:hypothetical protein
MMASLQPKNSGGPIAKFWDGQETIGGLEHVKGWLCKHAKKVSSTVASVIFSKTIIPPARLPAKKQVSNLGEIFIFKHWPICPFAFSTTVIFNKFA